MDPCFFTAPSPLHMFAITGVLGYRFADCNSIFSVQTFTRQMRLDGDGVEIDAADQIANLVAAPLVPERVVLRRRR